MPYKDPIKRKEYYHRTQKRYQYKWVEENREAFNKYQREFKQRTGGYKRQWDSVKSDPEKLAKAYASSRKYQATNKETLAAKQREQAKNLDDRWIVRQIGNKYGLSRKIAKNMPDLIEAERLTQKIKRYVKQN